MSKKKQNGRKPSKSIPASYFYTPALKIPYLLKNKDCLNFDAVVIDLEDSIHIQQKQAARKALQAADFSQITMDGMPLGLRLNSIHCKEGLQDLIFFSKHSNILPMFEFVLLPKVNHPEDVNFSRNFLSEAGFKGKYHSFIETIKAVEGAMEIAQNSDGLHYGQADLTSLMYAPNQTYIDYAIGRMCAAAAAYSIPMIDTNSFELKNLKLVREQSDKSVAAGFTGKAAIHPSHIDIINDAFTTSEETIQNYRSIIDIYNRQSDGFKIEADKIVAPPFVTKARLFLKMHGLDGG